MTEKDRPEKCAIWGTPAKYLGSSGDYLELLSDRTGGAYRVTNSAKKMLEGSDEFDQTKRVLLTNWLCDQRKQGVDCPTVTSYVLDSVPSLTVPTIMEQCGRALDWLYRNMKKLDQQFSFELAPINYPGQGPKIGSALLQVLTANCGVIDESDAISLLNFNSHAGFVNITDLSSMGKISCIVSLTFEGLKEAERRQSTSIESEQAFVAMWFGSQMDECYENGFKSAIEDAGYRPMRIDRKEHNNKIDDEIIAEIRRSKFVVADFTSEIIAKSEIPRLPSDTAIARGGVYFEAGFAKGLGKEVIWTVRKDLIDLVHFDTRQFAHITWSGPKDLREQLSARISATLGDGPLKKKS